MREWSLLSAWSGAAAVCDASGPAAMATLGLSKVFILDKYFTELQKFWETEKKLQGERRTHGPRCGLSRRCHVFMFLSGRSKTPTFLTCEIERAIMSAGARSGSR